MKRNEFSEINEKSFRQTQNQKMMNQTFSEKKNAKTEINS